MPLHDRRPKLLELRLEHSGSFSSSGSGSDEMRTPLPFAPIPFKHGMSQGSMVMTPDTPSFDVPSLDLFASGVKRDRSPSHAREEADVEWTEHEDGLLQSYLTAPAAGAAYPPGTLPPSDALDQMTTAILHRSRKTLSITSMTSVSSTSSSSTDEDEITTDTETDDVDDLDLDMKVDPGRTASPSTTVKTTHLPWRHSWSATRKRLFDIARLESREAVGGHRRDKSESIVPITMEGKMTRPKLVVLGPPGMSRQQNSMDSLFGAEEQSIQEAVRLSGNLQSRALQGSNAVLHRNNGLSSPVTFEFGGPKPAFRKPSVGLAPNFPAASRSAPRPSLLQRGHSYTGADLARESQALAPAVSPAPATSDEFAIDIDEDGNGAANKSCIPTFPSARPLAPPSMLRSVSSPTRIGFAGATSPISFSSILSSSIGEDTEPDPVTPLNQTCFPASVHGLGPFRPGSVSSDGDSTPGNTPSKSTPAITLTVESPKSPLSPVESRSNEHSSDSSDSTPRLGSSAFPRAPALDAASASASAAFANLSITSPIIRPESTSAFLSSLGGFNFTSNPGAASTSSAGFPPLASTSLGFGAHRGIRPLPLSRSLSDLTPQTIGMPQTLSSSTSLNALSSLSGTTPAPPMISIAAPSAPTLSFSVSAPSLPSRSSAAEFGRETKRQRALVELGSNRLKANNLGLSVIVPTGVEVGAGSLRSPFEHKPTPKI